MTDNVRLGNWVGEGWRRIWWGGSWDIIRLQFSVWRGRGISQQMLVLAIYPTVIASGAIVWDTLSSLTPALSALWYTEIPSAQCCGDWLFQGALLVAFCSSAAVFAINLAGVSPAGKRRAQGYGRALLWGTQAWESPHGSGSLWYGV